MKASRAISGYVCLGCVVALTLVGCDAGGGSPPSVAMANPASVYCKQQEGKLEIRHEKEGDVGYCHLAYGRVVEEWVLYRAAHKQTTTAASK
ncbi:DUF333 domain-containing protein [Asaia sp. VD9]|uniref:putative hemolysin n=1 Tax=Asaia sp. VD9 TaxID=3081235 RepID=UPI0030191F68